VGGLASKVSSLLLSGCLVNITCIHQLTLLPSLPLSVWDKYTTQKSDPIYLEQGQSYYLEVLHKEGGGADHLAVAWECLEGNIALEVVGSSYISALPPVPTESSSPTSEVRSSCLYAMLLLDFHHQASNTYDMSFVTAHIKPQPFSIAEPK